MGSTANKISLIVLAGVIAAAVWYVGIPYIKNLEKGTIQQKIDLEVNSNTAERKPIDLTVGTSTLSADLAVTEDEQEKGLGGRSSLGDNQGMLFVFDKPDYISIWMKDMLFPIDIAWLDKDFKVITVQEDVSPNTYPKSYTPEKPSLYVLEVNAGYFKEHGVSAGDTLRF